MLRANTGDWGKYYRAAAEKRDLLGGDPLKLHLRRYIQRQRFLFGASSLLLAALLTAFYVVLMR